MLNKRKFLSLALITLSVLVPFSRGTRQEEFKEKEEMPPVVIHLDGLRPYANWRVIAKELEIRRQFEEIEKQIGNRSSIYPDYFMDAINKFVLETEGETISQVIIRLNQKQYPDYLIDAANTFVIEIKNGIEREAKEEQKQTINRYPDIFVNSINGGVFGEVNNTVFSKLFPEIFETKENE
jgi:hypothetical protein